jgi:hypothetical protein
MRLVFALLALFAAPAQAATYVYTSGAFHTEDYTVGPTPYSWFTPRGAVLGLNFTAEVTAQLSPSTVNVIDAGTFQVGGYSGFLSEVEITTNAANEITSWFLFMSDGGGDYTELVVTDSSTYFSSRFEYDYACPDPNDTCIGSEETLAYADAGSWAVVPLPASGLLLLTPLGWLAVRSRLRQI